MCGICGQFKFVDASPVDPSVIRRMSTALTHRGPDDEGIYTERNIGLGFRRLAIIDLDNGHQPMTDSEKCVWVVFNGEIYNFIEVREILKGMGHEFRTNSDTEVIVNGYKEWGVDVLHQLNGMFGVAIWDNKKGRLMLARDRLGIKPLYYEVENGCLTFGSEIRALLAARDKRPPVEVAGINMFLRYRYTPAPYTCFKGIKKLAPGTRLVATSESYRVERWWTYKPTPLETLTSPQEAEAELREAYGLAVRRQLRSDVPVGLLLSGGLDSGLLLALMSTHGEGWNTYTVGFGGGFRKDELRAAAATASAFGAANEAVLIDKNLFQEALENVMGIVEEPVAASSIVPMYYLCQRASADLKVVLMGQGPDELFGGYKRHLGLWMGGFWRSLPEWTRAGLRGALERLPRLEMIQRGLYSLDAGERMSRYKKVFSVLPSSTVESLFKPNVLRQDGEEIITECWKDLESLMLETDEIGGLQFLELRSALPDELLMYADKLSMAHGLEVRVPYLDHEIVEYAERLATHLKIRHGKGKWIHRKICKSVLPRGFTRRQKRGFETPMDQWLADVYDPRFSGVLRNRDALMYEYLDRASVFRLLDSHISGRSDNSKSLFSLMALESWMQANA